MVGDGRQSPYTPAMVDSAFRGLPTGLRFDMLIRAFEQHGQRSSASPETATRRGGVRSTLFLIGIDARALHTASLMDSAESLTAAGRAAWRRQRRLAYYLWHAFRRGRPRDMPPLLFLADLDDLADTVVSDGSRALPKLASSRGACGMKIAVPIPLKGFGTTDLERWLASSRSGALLARQSLPKWEERVAMGVWRGSARTVLPSETCPAVPDFSTWEAHPRGRLVALCRRHPDLLDSGYTELEKLPGGNTTPVPLVAPLPFDGLRRYKYQVEVDGHGYQASLLAKMLLGSTVVTQSSHWPLWYAEAVVDGVHALTMRADLADLPARLRWLRRADGHARQISARGAELVHALLDSSHLTAHMTALLDRYARLFDGPAPPLTPLYASLCAASVHGGRTRRCSVYNLSSPPPRFARVAEHRHHRPSAQTVHRATGAETGTETGGSSRSADSSTAAPCPTAHFSDAHHLQCDRWCKPTQRAEHCTWCKCGACAWCGGRSGSPTIMLPTNFGVG